MTIIDDFEEKCSMCGKTSRQPVMMSTNTCDYPDLDYRPSEMQRSTMFVWLHECPHCGHVAKDLQKERETDPEILKTDSYLTCDGYDFKSDLAKRFYRHHLISKAERDYGSEFLSLLHCAWVCDDNDDELAVEMRKLSLKSIEKVVPQSEGEKIYLTLTKADMLRRTGQFEEVIREFKDVVLEEKLENDVLTFQIELAMKKDSECHRVREVVERKRD